ncbi:hypothetical protein [Geodermatophilus sp. SYSU D01176]
MVLPRSTAGVVAARQIASRDVHRSIKDALDPSGLLNHGTVLRRRDTLAS